MIIIYDRLVSQHLLFINNVLLVKWLDNDKHANPTYFAALVVVVSSYY